MFHDILQKDGSILLMPLLTEILIINDLLTIDCIFSMFLQKSEDNPSSPFLAVIVVEL